jgi:hypothetical protein
MAIPIQVTFDCANPARVASFWAEAHAEAFIHEYRERSGRAITIRHLVASES